MDNIATRFTSWLEPYHKDWSKLLWAALLIGITLNAAYLLWPQWSPPLEIRVHPGSLKAYDTLPILVSSDPNSIAGDTLIDPSEPDNKPAKIKKSKTSSGKKGDFQGVINFNTAPASQLQLLPGIGPAMASRIITYRKQVGRIASCQDLNNVSGIGPKKLAKILPHCKV